MKFLGQLTVEVLSAIVLLLSIPCRVSGAIPDVLDKCCDIGRQWFVTNREICPVYTSPVHGIHPNDQVACSGLIQLCCLIQRQEKQCNLGKQSAKIRQSCDGLHSQPGSEDARECCNCCHLGIIANKTGLSCSLFSHHQFDSVCKTVFEDCCDGDWKVNADSSPSDSSHLSSSSSSSSSEEEEEEEEEEDSQLNICAKFPGQLCAHICINTPGSYECACHDGFALQSDRRTCHQNSLVTGQCALNNPCHHRCNESSLTLWCSCFDGYTLDVDGRRCKDVNECANHNMSPCSRGQVCINTEGSYRCQEEVADQGPNDDLDVPIATTPVVAYGHNSHLNCGTGFMYNRHSGQCEDINECESDGCPELSHMCQNTIGSYRCTRMCDRGFQYNSRRRACEDMNECALNRDTCVEGQTCENTIGSFMCRRTISCGTGYTLDQSSQLCLDDDECQLGTHNCGVARECVNIPGSFRCISKQCPRGYQLDFRTGNCNPVICPRGLHADDVGNCVDINECVETPDVCRSNQECRNTIGSYICRSLISCSPGYELNEGGTRCEDVDECRTGTHECHGALMQCINHPGSYTCQCPEGYQINHILKVCEDFDECQFNSHTCAQNARCENTYGSYRCVCREGLLTEQDGHSCSDVDECERPGMCQHTCRNTWSSFQCLCNDGYRLAPDGRTCDDVDECQQAADAGVQMCIGICQNTDGSFACVCPTGYQMASDGRTCQDINECALQTASCRHPDDVCINTRGGYKCQTVACPSGFVKAPIIGNRNSNVKCQRKTFVCSQGDVECLYAPLSYSTNFITFPSQIRTPAELFTMRGPLSPYRRLVFDLKMIRAHDPLTGETRVNRAYFAVRQMRDNEAVIQLLREVPGAQDIELQLDMNIYSKEFGKNNDEIFFGTAVARIFIYVTKEDW